MAKNNKKMAKVGKGIAFGVTYAPAAAVDTVEIVTAGGLAVTSGIIKRVARLSLVPAQVSYAMGKESYTIIGKTLFYIGSGVLAVPGIALGLVAGAVKGVNRLVSCVLETVALPFKQLAYKIKGINYIEHKKKIMESFKILKDWDSDRDKLDFLFKYIENKGNYGAYEYLGVSSINATSSNNGNVNGGQTANANHSQTASNNPALPMSNVNASQTSSTTQPVASQSGSANTQPNDQSQSGNKTDEVDLKLFAEEVYNKVIEEIDLNSSIRKALFDAKFASILKEEVEKGVRSDEKEMKKYIKEKGWAEVVNEVAREIIKVINKELCELEKIISGFSGTSEPEDDSDQDESENV